MSYQRKIRLKAPEPQKVVLQKLMIVCMCYVVVVVVNMVLRLAQKLPDQFCSNFNQTRIYARPDLRKVMLKNFINQSQSVWPKIYIFSEIFSVYLQKLD